MKKIVALLILTAFASYACYNTYYISLDELKQIQNADQGTRVSVTSDKGDKVVVETTSRRFVRDVDGKRYPITPYNYYISNAQLVASDRDYIFMLNQLAPENAPKGEIDLLSTGKTVGLIALGVGAVTALIVVTAVTAGRKSFSN